VASDLQQDIQEAVTALQQGQLIAYPTESVFGLGCDPQQSDAVERLVKLKKRDADKGLIIIASNFEQLLPYIDTIDESIANHAKSFWPGPVTWLWPVKKSASFSPLLTGKHQTIAVRVTAHPVAVALCDAFQGAVISTSANSEGSKPAKSAKEVQQYFSNQLTKIINADVGELLQPTSIYDVMTKAEIRN